MTKNTIVKNKNNGVANKIVFAVLSFLIVALLVFNVIKMSKAYFTDQRTSNSPVITTGNVAIAYNLFDKNGIEVSSPFYMDDNQLVPGTEIPFTLEIQNKGTRSCYLRIKLDFFIKNGNDWDPDTTGNVTVASNDDETTTFRVSSDGYLYYKPNGGKITANQIVEIPVKIVISGSFDPTSSTYKNKNFGLQFGIQAMQTENITQTTTSGWTTKDSQDNDVYVAWDG